MSNDQVKLYRANAFKCAGLAQNASDIHSKLTLLEMGASLAPVVRESHKEQSNLSSLRTPDAILKGIRAAILEELMPSRRFPPPQPNGYHGA